MTIFSATRLAAAAALLVAWIGASAAQEVPADSVRSDSLRTYAAPTIVVTATRTEKALAKVSAPVTVIRAADMRRQGMLRLDDALASALGLALVDNHGTGLQMQGLAPEYTLILIDGEPVIGRTAGTLDLRRLMTHGLERIEIVRGPSSSLYGSEALAGVVNLITAAADAPAIAISARAGTHGSTDLSANAATGGDWGGMRLVINRNASKGYDLAPDTYGATVGAFTRYTSDLRSRFRTKRRMRITLGSRVSVEDQSNTFAIRGPGETDPLTESAQEVEWSVHPEVKISLGKTGQMASTVYVAGYHTQVRQHRDADHSLYYADDYNQLLAKAETQLDAAWTAEQLTTAGSGITRERLHGDRYDIRPDAWAGYAFIRHEWHPAPSIQLNAGARYDAHADYAARLSPNAGLFWQAGKRLQLRLSMGSGFKAPALRQRYLAFTNAAAGYSVLGAERVLEGLARLKTDGQIRQVFINLDQPGSIRAETSVGVNAGFTLRPGARVALTGHLFHNDVQDLIETQPIAQKTNGSFVYGYFNIARIYTRGISVQVQLLPLVASGGRRITVSLGYQYLQARDPDIVRTLRRGDVFGRLPSGREVRLGVSDYSGLFGRSPHMATMAATMTWGPKHPALTLRGRWRNRYGYRDLDGNRIANRPDEFVDAYAVVGVTVTQSLGLGAIALQTGMDNALSVTRPQQVPSLPGRQLWASLIVNL